METRQADGMLKPGSNVWCVRGRQLIKCSVEQLRHASEREELLETLAKDQGEPSTPWTFTRLAEELGGNQYLDLTGEAPTPMEWERAQDLREEVPPTRFRVRSKRGAPEATQEPTDAMEDDHTPSAPSSGPRVAQRARRDSGSQALKAECWYHAVPEESWPSQATAYWNQSQAAVEIAIDMPQTGNQWTKVTKDLGNYFVGAMKRQAVEVSERRLSPQEFEEFQAAKLVEVRNFISAGAFEALPQHLQPSKEQAIGMRWVLTWKAKEDGSRKAKARAVLLGYQDPCYEHRSTTAPVMTRSSRQFLIQIAANNKWNIFKGDVSGAFLQGRDYPSELYCIPCPEICSQMNIPAGSITRLRKACLRPGRRSIGVVPDGS